LYTPGHYTKIQVKGTGAAYETALFVPGLYYLDQDLDINTNSCVRPATDTGDGSKGVTFYFSGSKSLNLSGGDCNSATISPFVARASGSPVNDSVCITSGAGSSTLPATLPDSFSGSVLFGPCTGTYGDPQGTSDPAGEQRGLLFFQNPSSTPSGGNAPSWTGGGTFWMVGNLYFHNSSSYNTSFTFNAGSSGTGYFTGAIITDQFTLGGNSNLQMYLNSLSGFVALKATFLK
jgi:hypothetical protein